ncbi:MAG: hypothetical protein KDJ38_07675 [Gammaproteobacteria bacterium]|nr:hypothetical protein [Gammaproteobacteria bacterium]
MLEYVFFDPHPCDKFIAFLQEKNIPFTPPEDEDVLMVSVAEDLGDEVAAMIEAYYDEMMELGSEILSNQTGDGQINAAGLTVTLKDGRVSYAVLEPAIVNKVLDVLSLDELNTLVNAIADAVENPDSTPLCKRTYD